MAYSFGREVVSKQKGKKGRSSWWRYRKDSPHWEYSFIAYQPRLHI